MFKPHIRKPLLCAALCALLLSASLPAFADYREIDWQPVRKTLDCNGTTVEIDAITDPNIPATAAEWTARPRVWTEEQLRAVVAIASPGDENAQRHPHDDPDDIVIYDDIMQFIASVHLGTFLLERPAREKDYDYGAHPWDGQFYHRYEPIDGSVPTLSQIDYQGTLSKLLPFFEAVGCEVGTPSIVWAWDREQLQKNWDDYPREIQDIGPRQWMAEEESYKLIFPAYFQGMRLVRGYDSSYGNDENNSGIVDLRVDARGIGHCQIDECVFADAQPVTPLQKVLTLDEAIEAYRQMRANTAPVDDLPYFISKILLQYRVRETFDKAGRYYELIPIWCFYHERPSEDPPFPNQIYEMIHAITGEFIAK